PILRAFLKSGIQPDYEVSPGLNRSSRQQAREVDHVQTVREIEHVSLKPQRPVIRFDQIDSGRGVQRGRWPHAPSIEVHLADDFGSVLLPHEVHVAWPPYLKWQAAVVGRAESHPCAAVRLQPHSGSQGIALVLCDRK